MHDLENDLDEPLDPPYHYPHWQGDVEDIPDADLPGMWERADFTGGQDEHRGPDWTRDVDAIVDAPASAAVEDVTR